jgi:hypothetical protein
VQRNFAVKEDVVEECNVAKEWLAAGARKKQEENRQDVVVVVVLLE